jgi:hypothetical protein
VVAANQFGWQFERPMNFRHSTILLFAATTVAGAQAQSTQVNVDSGGVPSLTALVAKPMSELAGVVDRFNTDVASISRRYDASGSPAQRARMREFYSAWLKRVAEIDFEKLGQEGKVDYVLLSNYLKHQLALIDRREKQRSEMAMLIPFADRLLALQDSRRNLTTIDSRRASSTLAAIAAQVDTLRTSFEAPATPGDSTKKSQPRAPKVSKTVANRAADNVDQVRTVVGNWYKYYDGYDPTFSWWTRSPYKRLDESL